jgi:hypothetical protein
VLPLLVRRLDDQEERAEVDEVESAAPFLLEQAGLVEEMDAGEDATVGARLSRRRRLEALLGRLTRDPEDPADGVPAVPGPPGPGDGRVE